MRPKLTLLLVIFGLLNCPRLHPLNISVRNRTRRSALTRTTLRIPLSRLFRPGSWRGDEPQLPKKPVLVCVKQLVSKNFSRLFRGMVFRKLASPLPVRLGSCLTNAWRAVLGWSMSIGASGGKLVLDVGGSSSQNLDGRTGCVAPEPTARTDGHFPNVANDRVVGDVRR